MIISCKYSTFSNSSLQNMLWNISVKKTLYTVCDDLKEKAVWAITLTQDLKVGIHISSGTLTDYL